MARADRPDEPETIVVGAPASGASFTASARRVDLTTRDGRKLIGKLKDWQTDAQTFRRSIGIVDRGTRFHGSALARLRFYAGVVVEPDEEPIPVEDAVDDPEIALPQSVADVATAEWARVTNSLGGREQLQRKWGALLSTIGDSWCVAAQNEDDPDLEDWDVYSPAALSVKGSGETTQVLLKETPDGTPRELIDPVAYRIWRSDDEWPGLADSPLRAVFGEMEEYLIYARQFRALGKSRIPAPILKVPTEVDPPRQPAPLPDGTIDSTQTGLVEPTPLERKMMDHFLTSIEAEGSAGAVFGGIFRAKYEYLDRVEWMVPTRPFDAELIPRIDNLMRRIADGIDLPPDLLLGLADANHWTGWLIEDSTYKAHIQPLAAIPAIGMTAVHLRPALRLSPAISDADKREWIPKIVIGIDASALVARPNRAADATSAFHEGGISWSAWRKHLGFTEADAPDEAELELRAKYGFTPRTAAAAIASTEATTPGDLPGEGGGTPTPGTAPARIQAGDGIRAIETTGRPLEALQAAATGPRSRAVGLGSRLHGIESRLRERLVAAASTAVTDALRRAGSRLRSSAQSNPALRASVNGLPPDEVGRALGLAAAAGLVNPDELLAGAFDGLHDKWDTLVAAAQKSIARALRAAGGADRPDLDDALRDYEDGNPSDRDRGWAVLLGAVTAATRSRLFEEEARVLTGEFDPTLAVQMGAVRDALTAAGGIEGGVPSSTGYAGGLTGGTEVGALLDTAGLFVDGWQWVTGAPTVPFEPHQNLEGFVFTDWSDDVLSNVESWPPFSFYYPGDHFGCQCDTVAVVVEESGRSLSPGDQVGTATVAPPTEEVA